MLYGSTVCLSFNDYDHLYWKLYAGHSKRILSQGCENDAESITKIKSGLQDLDLD